MEKWLPFEKPLIEVEQKLAELRELEKRGDLNFADEIRRLERKAQRLQKIIYGRLTRWQKVELARHPLRPYSLDYIQRIADDFVELHGDRGFADDKALIGGIGRIDTHSVMIVGQQKGRSTKEKLVHNFGMMNPEGYRKALRLFHLAQKFSLPIVSLIDTPGAFCGIGAEERGQAEAIARNLVAMVGLETPILIIVIGEGASGGALGIGIGDRVLMMENAWYSVISPEGCSAILWKTRERKQDAAEVLKLTAPDLIQLKVIDEIIPEPIGGAHRDPNGAALALKQTIVHHLHQLKQTPIPQLLELRHQKLAALGQFVTR